MAAVTHWRISIVRPCYFSYVHFSVRLSSHCPSSPVLHLPASWTLTFSLPLETTDSRSNSFDWVVQVYNFDLTYSNDFFFWLFQGDYSSQGHSQDAKNMVSGYFFISYEDTSASTSSSPSAAATTTATTTSATSLATSEPSSRFTSAKDRKLSTGATAGIAVSAAGGGLAIVAAVVFFIRYRSRKNRELQQAMSVGGGSQFYPTPYTSPLPPGAEMYYKSHGVPLRPSLSATPHACASEFYRDTYTRPINREPVEL